MDSSELPIIDLLELSIVYLLGLSIMCLLMSSIMCLIELPAMVIMVWNVNNDLRQDVENIRKALPECLMESRFADICTEIKYRLVYGGIFVIFEITDIVSDRFMQFGKANGWSMVFGKYKS